MSSPVVSRVAAAIIIAIGVVGTADAGIDRAWDHLVLFAAAIVLGAVCFATATARRRALLLRTDVAVWVHERAALAGEPPERLAERALAAYRDGLLVRDDERIEADPQPEADRTPITDASTPERAG